MAEGPSAADLALLDPDGSFAARLAEDRAALAGLADALSPAAAEETRDGKLAAIERIAHQLAGAAGTFGHAAVGTAALELEERIVALRRAPGARPGAAAEALGRLLDALDRAVGIA